MSIKQIQEAREAFGIDDWGSGYYGIDADGNVVCQPRGPDEISIPLIDIIKKSKEQNLNTPLILRFPQIVSAQLSKLHQSFSDAIWEYNYKGKHQGVFPFKVNQRKEFIDQIVETGQQFDYGLEIGSKTEFIAALSYELSDKSLLICNGFKDAEFIELAFIAKAMGKNVILVVEGPDELQLLIDYSKKYSEIPGIGFRMRLYSKGSGKWAKSSGDTSKFGLTTSEVLHALDLIKEADLKSHFKMLHFHIGSQITQIKRFKNALKEAARVYAKIYGMGFEASYLNIGGGVGVDYDGSKTSFQSSANYTMQEFANDAVYVIGDVCTNENVAHPTIITESGRVIAAYHSVVVTDIREVQGEESLYFDLNSESSEKVVSKHKCLRELKYIYRNINKKNFSEYYHDAIEYYEELFTLFNLGYLNLQDRALGEELYQSVCLKALYFSTFQGRDLDEFDNLQKKMVTKYLANFSIFQSIPDAWAIDQLFPVMPLSRHNEKPSHKGTIVDITCDSDGCLDRFIDKREIKPVLDLHTLNESPYHIGFFLVGAYQESLANEHNLFGAIHEAEVIVDKNGEWKISKFTTGDPVAELLEIRNYDMKNILKSYKKQLSIAEESKKLSTALSGSLYKKLKHLTNSYPYLISSNDF